MEILKNKSHLNRIKVSSRAMKLAQIILLSSAACYFYSFRKLVLFNNIIMELDFSNYGKK